MPTPITIQAGEVELAGELNDTDTARQIAEALPIEARANTWGDEIYFEIPVDAPLENGQEVVEVGDLGYWPPGRAFCLFFGPTPMSRGDEVRPASPVNVVGKMFGDPKVLCQVSDGAPVRLLRGGSEDG